MTQPGTARFSGVGVSLLAFGSLDTVRRKLTGEGVGGLGGHVDGAGQGHDGSDEKDEGGGELHFDCRRGSVIDR